MTFLLFSLACALAHAQDPSTLAPPPAPDQGLVPTDPVTPPPVPRLKLDTTLHGVPPAPPAVPAPGDPALPPDARQSVVTPPPAREEPEDALPAD